MIRELRPHQIEAMDKLKASLRSGKRRPMMQAPTGFGKTLLATAIVDGALSKGNRVLFVVPALSLIDQTVQSLYLDGIEDVGVIQADHHLTDWAKPCQVASIQTLQRRPLPRAAVVVIDEAHKMFDFTGKWMAMEGWEKIPFIGLSATPWTKGLGKFYDDLIIAETTAGLIEKGYLSSFRVFAPSHPDLAGVKTVGGDYHEGQLAEVMGESAIVADVVTTWLERGEDRPTLVFCVDRAHAKKLDERFANAGVSSAYMDAYTDGADREVIKRRFHNGDIRVVCNVGVLTTGVDWDVRCIVMARPTKSEILFVQIIGRGLRTAPSKSDCLILDHSDNHLRLGFVTDITHEHLDDGKPKAKADPKEKEALPKECPKCTFLKPPKTPICPVCGFKAEVKSKLREGDGELVELTKGGKKQFTMEEKQRWYSEFLWYAESKGFRPGWAANKYREKFGVWPRGLMDRPRGITLEVSNWIRAANIRWAKAKEKANASAAAE